MSISSRGLVYFPDKLQKRLKLRKPGKFSITFLENDKIEMRPVKDIFSMVGKLKAHQFEHQVFLHILGPSHALHQ